jgi:hypothetical protein
MLVYVSTVFSSNIKCLLSLLYQYLYVSWEEIRSLILLSIYLYSHAGRCRGSEPGALKHARSRPRWHRARAGGGHARRPVLHLAHKATSCIAFLGDSPETQSSWQRGDVLRRVYLAMLEEDVHIIAGSAKWESRDCEVRWLVNADGDDPGTGRRSQRRQARRYAMQSLQECGLRSSGRADGQQRTWRLPVTEVTRLRHLGEEEAEKDVERQLIT